MYKEFYCPSSSESEVERIQRKLEKQRVKLQKDFETWFDVVKRESQISDNLKRAKEAWQPPKSKKPFPPSNPDQSCARRTSETTSHISKELDGAEACFERDAGADSS